jgi:hypothetical protein
MSGNLSGLSASSVLKVIRATPPAGMLIRRRMEKTGFSTVPVSGSAAPTGWRRLLPRPMQRPVGFELHRDRLGAFDDGNMRGPDLGVTRRPAAARGDDHPQFGQAIRHDEQFREGRVGDIRLGRGQHQFRARGRIDVARHPPGIGQRHAARLGIVF